MAGMSKSRRTRRKDYSWIKPKPLIEDDRWQEDEMFPEEVDSSDQQPDTGQHKLSQ